ncbi:MAG: cyclopropane fatty acyl phospholipid synthase [Candidatus Gastranaerophilaceae bacterium]|jgi:cyclopropane-fatty-acyl-phospholipid synthase
MASKDRLCKIFAKADIKIINNGSNEQVRSWDIIVNNKNFYDTAIRNGSLGFGESYMDNWWSCQNLDEFFYKLLKTNISQHFKYSDILFIIKSKLFNLQSLSRAFKVGERHYDIGNDLYKVMLDKRMVYTCGYWENAQNLDEAQEAKLDLICKKLNLKPDMHILDIGCGWGSFAKYAAEHYNVKVTGVTISKEQIKLGQHLCKNYDVNLLLMDYRDLPKLKIQFDRIVSIGMFEHVGVKNYRKYMEVANHCLVTEGIFLLHTIGKNISSKIGEPFFHKYIFPNGMIPSIQQISKSIEKLFTIENLQNIGPHYDKTLMNWYENFEKNWPKLSADNPKYDERFFRLWQYYLLSCAGSFRARHCQVWQIAMTKLHNQNQSKDLYLKEKINENRY